MGSFAVMMLLGFEQRPTRDEQAFLGGLDAKVLSWGIADLRVELDLDAPDMAAALSRAQELVVAKLGGELLIVRLTVPGNELRPGSLWDRLRRRRRPPVDDRDDTAPRDA
jgi:hypothetical protein